MMKEITEKLTRDEYKKLCQWVDIVSDILFIDAGQTGIKYQLEGKEIYVSDTPGGFKLNDSDTMTPDQLKDALKEIT